MRSLGLRLLVTFVVLSVLALLFAASLAVAGESRRAPAPPALTAPAPTNPAPAAATPQPLTGTPDSTSFLGAGSKLLVASLALAGLLYVAMRVVRRLPISRFLPSADGPIRLIARTHLGSRESLCLIEVASTRLLVGMSAQGMETLHVWPEAGASETHRTSSSPSRSAFETRVPGQLRALQGRVAGGSR